MSAMQIVVRKNDVITNYKVITRRDSQGENAGYGVFFWLLANGWEDILPDNKFSNDDPVILERGNTRVVFQTR